MLVQSVQPAMRSLLVAGCYVLGAVALAGCSTGGGPGAGTGGRAREAEPTTAVAAPLTRLFQDGLSVGFGELAQDGTLDIEVLGCHEDPDGHSAFVYLGLQRRASPDWPAPYNTSVRIPVTGDKPQRVRLQLAGQGMPGEYGLSVSCGLSDTLGPSVRTEFTVEGPEPIKSAGSSTAALALDPVPTELTAGDRLQLTGSGCRGAQQSARLRSRARNAPGSTGTSPRYETGGEPVSVESSQLAATERWTFNLLVPGVFPDGMYDLTVQCGQPPIEGFGDTAVIHITRR